MKDKGKNISVDVFSLSLIQSFVLVDEKGHEAKKEAHKEAAEERGVIGQIGDTISNAYNYVAEKVHGEFFFLIKITKRIRFVFRSGKFSVV